MSPGAILVLEGLVVALGSRLRLHSLTLFFVVQRTKNF